DAKLAHIVLNISAGEYHAAVVAVDVEAERAVGELVGEHKQIGQVHAKYRQIEALGHQQVDNAERERVAALGFNHALEHGVGRRVKVLGIGRKLVVAENNVVEHLHLVGGVHLGAQQGPGLKAQLLDGAVKGLKVSIGVLVRVEQPHAFEQVLGARIAPHAQALL
nr:hypothetical protein [Tanacetum cinerariifolium]